MSLQPQSIGGIPEVTATVARASFPKGNVYMKMRDELGVFFTDEDFAPLFPARGQPAESPWRLALITIMQFAENLTDRQAGDAVRGRIDWKYALGLELTDPGFHFSILTEFRERLLAGGTEQLLLDRLLTRFQELGLLKAGGRQRTDSSHVVAAVRELSRLECAGEALRQVLNHLAVSDPGSKLTSRRGFDRYRPHFEEYRLPKTVPERTALAETIGADGVQLLSALYQPAAPAHLRQEPAVETLRQVWIQLYYQQDGQTRWREKDNRPPAARQISSPYDPAARYASKRETDWTGYKVFLTETCEADAPT
jgi:transposase